MKKETNNNAEWIEIFPDGEMLHKYFRNYHLWKFATMKQSKSKIEYNKVAEILQEFGIADKQSIDNFCYILGFVNGNYFSIKQYQTNEAKLAEYYKEIGKLKKFFERETIENIGIKAAPKGAIQSPMITLKSERIINPIIKILKERSDSESWESIEAEKIPKGAKVTLQGRIKKQYKYWLLNFFKEYPELDKANQNTKFYFIGKLYVFAGILKEETEEIILAYDSYKKYLIKSIKNI
jgi:hypothetical protein